MSEKSSAPSGPSRITSIFLTVISAVFGGGSAYIALNYLLVVELSLFVEVIVGGIFVAVSLVVVPGRLAKRLYITEPEPNAPTLVIIAFGSTAVIFGGGIGYIITDYVLAVRPPALAEAFIAVSSLAFGLLYLYYPLMQYYDQRRNAS